MTEITTKRLVQLADVCGVSLSVAAERADISPRTVQYWVYKGVTPRRNIINRVWNAIIDEARETGGITDTVRDRAKAEIGVLL